METFSNLIKETLPNYLRSLPLPNNFTGLFKLSATDWLSLTPLLTLLTVPTYYLSLKYLKRDADASSSGNSKVNLNVKKTVSKVVDTIDIEEIINSDGKKKVLCRCWRSKAFPLCDGTHNQHNDNTGDNVGPVIIKSN